MTARVVGASGVPVTVATLADISGGGNITSSQITDATTVGKTVLTAADAATARTAIGAGVPYTLPAAATGTAGGVKKAATVSPCTVAADGTSAGTQLNALIAALQASGALS